MSTETKNANELVSTPGNGSTDVWRAYINTEAWLERVLGEECEDFAHQEPKWDDGFDIHGFEVDHSDNVYNHENEFSSVFNYTIYAPSSAHDWCYDTVYVAVCIHHGGDVRGNYGTPRLYRAEDLAESGFLDWSIGWYVTDEDGNNMDEDGMFMIGYSTCPTAELVDAFGEDGEWKDGAWHVEHEGKLLICTPYTGADWL